jgi:hydrogenase expression/formation protein HypE
MPIRRMNTRERGTDMEDTILLGHGSGGKLTQDLLKSKMLPHLDNTILSPLKDAASLTLESSRILFSTDSFVVNPPFFPGGDIGKLSLCGTINDLAVMGGLPRYLSLALILEEGFPMKDLEAVMQSIEDTAKSAGVLVVTGDTKVVERGHGDRIFITTAGIGTAHQHFNALACTLTPGDKIIINGPIGDHGIAVFAAREGLTDSIPVMSDCAPLNGIIMAVLDRGLGVRFMRDPTRGGLAMACNEMVAGNSVSALLFEKDLPVREGVEATCDLLGFDPLYLANEGKVMMVIAPADADQAVSLMKGFPEGRDARIIGEIIDSQRARVLLRTRIGGTRVIDMPVSDQLPRIC